jgi:hypothetical protein
MGLFTGLAIGALAAANVAQAFRKKPKLATDAPLAPGPVESLAPPKPPTILPGVNEGIAQAAGQKQRKRAAAGSLLTRPKPPVAGAAPVTAKPRSLIGVY